MSHNNEVPKGYEKTEELFIDPTNKKRYRVYYNATDGSDIIMKSLANSFNVKQAKNNYGEGVLQGHGY